MQFLPFHNLVKSFINRKDLTDNQIDFFINTALREFQLRQRLEFTRKSGMATYPSTVGTGIALPNVDAQFRALAGDYSVSLTTPSGAIIPLMGSTFETVQRRTQQSSPPAPTASVVGAAVPNYYVEMLAEVPTLFLFPEVADAVLILRFYSWIEEYAWDSGPTREDFLLKYGSQVLLWGALSVANRFVAEDAKVQLDTSQYEMALESLIRIDSTLPIEGATVNLD